MKKAFSLIELSIVIVIIGVLVAGVVASGPIISKFKLQTAQSLTKNSPVSGIKDLSFWLETTSEKSFDSTVDSASSSENSVATWYDIAPSKIVGDDATAPLSENEPKLVNNVINGLPALLFDNTNDVLVNQNYHTAKEITMFAVILNTAGDGYKRIISGYVNASYFMGTNNGNTRLASLYGDGSSSWGTIADFGSSSSMEVGKPYIVSTTMASTLSSGYVNGELVDTNTHADSKVSGKHGYAVGSYQNDPTVQPWGGYIAEIIVINRSIKEEERKAIDSYLSQKWGIKLSY